MKLTGILKTKVDKAETMEEKKGIIADAGMELNDDELNEVAGGYSRPVGAIKPGQSRSCNKCNQTFYDDDSYTHHMLIVHHILVKG